MDFKQELKNLKGAISGELERQFSKEIAKTLKEDPIMADALVQAKKIALSGGKNQWTSGLKSTHYDYFFR